MKASRHSSTALVIAKSTTLAAWDRELLELVPAGAVELCDWFVADHARDAELLREDWYRALLAHLEGLVLPGIRLHYSGPQGAAGGPGAARHRAAGGGDRRWF